jgi:hypothetical protein
LTGFTGFTSFTGLISFTGLSGLSGFIYLAEERRQVGWSNFGD